MKEREIQHSIEMDRQKTAMKKMAHELDAARSKAARAVGELNALRTGLRNDTDPGAVVVHPDEWARVLKERDAAVSNLASLETVKTLPRRRKDDDPTDTPIYLVQRRRFALTWEGAHALDWDSDREEFLDHEGRPHSEEEAVANGWGRWEWDVHTVAFTRDEADAYCESRAYDGPFRSYSVHAIGYLRVILQTLTDEAG